VRPIPERLADLRFCLFRVSVPAPPARPISCRMGSVWDQAPTVGTGGGSMIGATKEVAWHEST
jgi:hypothetical protein